VKSLVVVWRCFYQSRQIQFEVTGPDEQEAEKGMHSCDNGRVSIPVS
jgi:hypothetical protein